MGVWVLGWKGGKLGGCWKDIVGVYWEDFGVCVGVEDTGCG